MVRVTTQETDHVMQGRQADLVHLNRVLVLGELSAAMAHELGQPLTAIANNAYVGLQASRGARVAADVRARLADIRLLMNHSQIAKSRSF